MTVNALWDWKEKKEKVFFFEKKKQKTFVSLSGGRKLRDSEQKFFGSFFQKRTFFLPTGSSR